MQKQEIERLLTSGDYEQLRDCEPAAISVILDLANSNDTQIARRARLVLGQLRNPDSVESLIVHALDVEEKSALSICIAAQYTPKDLSLLAVLYCLAGEWDLLATLDNFQELLCQGLGKSPTETRAYILPAILESCEQADELIIRMLVTKDQAVTHDLVKAMRTVNKPDLAEKVALEWLRSRDTAVGQALRDLHWTATASTESKVLTVLNHGDLSYLSNPSNDEIQCLLQCLRDRDKEIQKNAARVLKYMLSEEGIDEICRLAARAEDRIAIQLVEKLGFEPSEHNERAIFHLLLGHWDSYSQLDFDRSLLSSSYAVESPEIQARIFERLKGSGHSDWLRSVVSSKERRNLVELNADEWNAIVEDLKRAEQWDEMWRLARVAPVRISAGLLRVLRTVGWQPDDSAHLHLFRELSSLALKCRETGVESYQFSEVGGAEINKVYAMSFQGDGEQLWVGNSTGRVTRRSTKDFSRTAIGPAHRNMVTCISTNYDGSLMLSGSNDGTVGWWSSQEAYGFFELDDCIRSVAIDSTGKLALAATDYAIHLWNIGAVPESSFVESEVLGGSVSSQMAVFSADSQKVIGCGSHGILHMWNLSTKQAREYSFKHRCSYLAMMGQWIATSDSGGRIYIFDATNEHQLGQIQLPTLITCCTAGNRYFFAGLLDGQIAVIDPVSCSCVKLWQAHPSRVTAVSFNAKEKLLATAMAESGFQSGVKIWTDRLRKVLDQPAKVLELNQVPDRREVGPGLEYWCNFANALVEAQKMFEIDITETNLEISVGEFDIELGDV